MTAERLLDDTIRMAPGIYGVPIVHGSAEFTVFIRRLILETPPRYIAVELPENMGPYIEKCLPYADAVPVISTIPNDETEPEMHFIMEPLEPIVEAVRSAYDFGIPVHYADIYSEYLAGLDPETFPDTYALKTTGVKGMYEEYIRSSGADTVSENPLTYIDSLDRIREIKMARDLRYLSVMIPGDDEELPGIIFVCGFRHMRNIINYLSMSEEDFSQYSGLIRESGLENALDGEEEPLEAMLKLRDSAAAGPDYNITVLSEESSEVLHQPGYFNSAWVLIRKHPQYVNHFSRLDLQRQAYRDAVQRYETESGELIPPQIQKLYFRFARNWSILENRLLPDLYKLVISARSFHNDNFARILHDVLSHMPPHSPAPFPGRKLTLDDLYKDSRLIRFRLREKNRRRIPPKKKKKRVTQSAGKTF